MKNRNDLVFVSIVVLFLGLVMTIIEAGTAFQRLSMRVDKLEKAQYAPSIVVTCRGSNPTVIITHLHEAANLWLELVPPNSANAAIFAFYPFASFGSQDVIDGGIGDMRGSGQYVVLYPGTYVLRGWTQAYTIDQPIFTEKDLIFSTSFTVPDCK